MSRRKRTIYFIVFTVLFLIFIPVLVLYSLGYTIDGATFGLSGRGGIYVSVPEGGVSVFIGNALKETTGIFKKEVLAKDLKPKDYLVVTGSEEYWPWAKIVTVYEGEVSALYPLLVPKEISFKEILKTDENYQEAVKLFSAIATSSSSADSRLSPNPSAGKKTSTSSSAVIYKKTKIWKDGNAIFSSWQGSADRIPPYFCNKGKCVDTILVFRSDSPIGRIDFYPGRDDAIMLTLENGVYAMEIDPRTYHNFYPIYRGNEPDFRTDSGAIYVKDGDHIYLLEL